MARLGMPNKEYAKFLGLKSDFAMIRRLLKRAKGEFCFIYDDGQKYLYDRQGNGYRLDKNGRKTGR